MRLSRRRAESNNPGDSQTVERNEQEWRVQEQHPESVAGHCEYGQCVEQTDEEANETGNSEEMFVNKWIRQR